MMRSGVRSFRLLLAGAVFAGCSGASASSAPTGQPPTSTPTAAVTAPPTAPPTPTPQPTIDIAAAGAAYLAIAKQLTDTVRPLLKELDSGSLRRAAVARHCRDISAAYLAAKAGFAGLTVPAEVMADLAQLVGFMGKVADSFQRCADDPTYNNVDEFNALVTQYQAVSARIRAALGLPPPPS